MLSETQSTKQEGLGSAVLHSRGTSEGVFAGVSCPLPLAMDEKKEEQPNTSPRELMRMDTSDSVFASSCDGPTNNSLPVHHTCSKRVKWGQINPLKPHHNLHDLWTNEGQLKASLFLHICNPLKRWKMERLFPYKLLIQLVKTVLLIVQVILFTFTKASDRSGYLFDSRLLFQQLFIQAFDGKSYTYTTFSPQQVLDEIGYAVERYYDLPNSTIGAYDYELDSDGQPLPVNATLKQYMTATLNPSDASYVFDRTTETTYFTLTRPNSSCSVTDQLVENGMDTSFKRFIDLVLTVHVTNIHLTKNKPDCYTFEIKLTYSNKHNVGKVSYSLETTEQFLSCDGKTLSSTKSSTAFLAVVTLLDLLITALCVTSFSFALHTFHRGYRLGQAMAKFYRCKLHLDLTWWDRRALFSSWLIFNCCSDVLIVLGSVLKILHQYDMFLDNTTVRIFLGSALILQAGAMLRYVSFFKELNALTRTLGLAFPQLLKFLICTSMLYLAFALCGMVVFGSYDDMFSTFGNSVEILFALLNGDSIWITFRAFNSNDTAIYVYSRLFVYAFISLFIYAVLNLFTSLVKASYEDSIIVDRAMINEVRRFVFSGPLTPDGVALRDVTYVTKFVDPAVVLNRRRRRTESIGDLD